MALYRQVVISGIQNGMSDADLALSRVKINALQDGHQYTGVEDTCGWMMSVIPIPIGVSYLMLVIMQPRGDSSSSILHSLNMWLNFKASTKGFLTGGSYQHGNISWIGD